MDDNKAALFLKSLKTALAHPALRQAGNDAQNAQLALVDPLLAGLLAQTVVPGLLETMRADYRALMPELEQVCRGDKAAEDALRKLQELVSPEQRSTLDAILRAAVEVQHALRTAASPKLSVLSKKMLAIERDYGNGLDAVYRQAIAPEGDGADASGATHSRAYDEQALGRFMQSAYPEEKTLSIARSSFISGGYSKYTIGIELAGNRVLPSSIILRADSSIGFGGSSVVEEYPLLQVLHAHGVCVPRPLALDVSEDVFGSPFLLMERRPGRSLGNMFNLPPPNANTSRDIAAKLAAIHKVPVDAFDKGIRGADTTSQEYSLAWIEQSHANWQALDTPGTLMETAFQWLKDNIHLYTGPRTLVHGDFALHNQLIEGEQVSAILDWEFAHIGNPVYDLGYFYFQALSLAPWEVFCEAYAAAGGILPEPTQLDYATLLAETRLTTMTRQAESAYYAGAPMGVAGAVNAAAGYRYASDERIAALLEKLM